MAGRKGVPLAHRLALALLTVGSLLILACLLVDHPAAPAVFVVSVLLFAPALVALGAARGGRIGRLALPLLLFALWLVGCGVAMLLLPGGAGAGWFGLPWPTVVMLFGLGFAPLIVVSLVYAWDFRRFGLRETDLRRLRGLARREDGRSPGD